MANQPPLPPLLTRADFEDDDEYELYLAVERGEFVPVDNFEERKKMWQQVARNTLKRKSVTFRAFESDIRALKSMAKAQGMPYQTLLNSVLHRYISGQLKEQ